MQAVDIYLLRYSSKNKIGRGDVRAGLWAFARAHKLSHETWAQ